MSCDLAEPVAPTPECITVVRAFDAKHVAAGHPGESLSEAAPGIFVGGYADATDLHLMVIAAPRALLLAPDDATFRLMGQCSFDGELYRVYEGSQPLKGTQQARSEKL